jgi:hypothetical protein
MMDGSHSVMTLEASKQVLENLAERLRAAVRSEAYDDVLDLLSAYHERFEQLLGEASGDLQESRRLFTEARDLIEWAKVTTLANRAHAQVSLSRVARAAEYMPAKAGYARTWQARA